MRFFLLICGIVFCLAGCRQADPPDLPLVTKGKYNQIAEGMSYVRVQLILGASGEEMSRATISDTTTIMYLWKNPDGSNMNAMFQNGQLIAKAQFGLP